MKLSKFNKNLKNEFNETINDNPIKEKRFKFKLRYAFLIAIVLFMVFVTIEHIYVLSYNANQKNNRVLWNKANLTSERYDSKDSLKKSLVYTSYDEKTSILQEIVSIFTFKGCGSNGVSYTPETSGGTSSDSDSSYNTNVQEKGIDEADYAKCDGTYIYSMSSGGLSIYNLDGTLITTNAIIGKLYVNNDKIVILSNKTYIYSFDGKSLKELKVYNYSAKDSRVSNNTLYFSTFGRLNLDQINYDNAYYDGSINPSNVYKIFKVNLNTLEEKEGDLVTSSSSIIYMSDNYIYIASNSSCFGYYNAEALGYTGFFTNIFILDYDLNGYAIINENGNYLNKYSFSEYNGNLRYVLTDRFSSEPILNSVYIYDLASKKKAGALQNQIGLAGELVKSVRFSQNLCYVCTYRNTDPLYKIDLSDPENIKILSELHVSGYSDYLHNFTINGNTYILGIGYSDDRYSKISIYNDNDELTQVGKSLLIERKVSEYLITFDSDIYYVDGNYIDGVINENYLGYMFYIKDNILYFASAVSSNTHAIFKIDLNNTESPISVYKEHIYKNDNSYGCLRCFLINGKLYFVGDGAIHIEDF